ncbi:class I SAM-dependent methyltransferase [Blastococcus goldschmidtiae]|uniref:Methyltransferase domain-containing protein n=1 Tax=Blastococcus goldschmidtiae TaxID=3075546 RepID=A0ABU2K804_9ACTN|nr:methyltransferase domain-containing protein [Blastococcus sp. DSM 46792]MDT0276301.1 methyltransferase domain-containing protein [Blastococcus sp. DSM 46792]
MTLDRGAPAALYDEIGRTYGRTRRPDPRIAAAIRAAVGEVDSVVNVGAGAGAYEPLQTVLAVEPSRVMIDQRPAGAAPVVQGVAEALPLPDRAVDAALAVLTVHHWSDVGAGVAEMRRVARRRAVFFTWWPGRVAEFWLLREYLPAAAETDARHAVPVEQLLRLLGPAARVRSVPVPHDCTDGFGAAYWRRPEAYLDAEVRAGISMLARTEPTALRAGLQRLEDDLRSGAWRRRHADLLAADALDEGYCVVTVDL